MQCSSGKSCPYLNGSDIWGLLREIDYLRERIVHIEGLMGLAKTKIRELTEENMRLLVRWKKDCAMLLTA